MSIVLYVDYYRRKAESFTLFARRLRTLGPLQSAMCNGYEWHTTNYFTTGGHFTTLPALLPQPTYVVTLPSFP